jgi:hypothetical protein
MRAKRAIGQGHVLALPGVTPQAVPVLATRESLEAEAGRIGADYSSSSSATARSTVATLPEVLASGWRPRR